MMMPAANPLQGLRDAYAAALARYVAAPDEAALADAYSHGRSALTCGLGLIDWAALHEEALVGLGPAGHGAEALARAGLFFRESLSPFEMTQRGYAETNTWLERLNRELRSEIAEKERLAEQLRQSNAELEAFSYSVAHDLRAPVRHIASFSQILLEDHGPELADGAREYLGRIQRGAAHMSELIDGLLALSRAMSSELLRQPVDLAARAERIVLALRQADPGRDVEVDIQRPLRAHGDPRLLDVLLENLIGNAWKFTAKKPGARIALGVHAAQNPPVFFVKDDGAGFDMAHAGKLFGVFRRLHGNDEFPGTGIGLATVQRVVRRHRGRIWAEAAVGRGATFFFTLPDEDGETA